MLRDGGRMVAIGIAPGTTTAPVEITRLVRRSQRIIGSYGARTRTDMPQVLALAALGAFRPEHVVSRSYSLDQVDEAYKTLAAGQIQGRAIIKM
jgi:S-(hydroxymethyl)glutathione dehydrogenase/alcohol dehydrogenase